MAGLRRAQTPPGTTPNTAGYFQYPAAPGAAPADAWTPPRLDPPYETGARPAPRPAWAAPRPWLTAVTCPTDRYLPARRSLAPDRADARRSPTCRAPIRGR